MNTLAKNKLDIIQGINVRTKLSIDVCNSLLLKGYTVSQIARATLNSPSAVSRFISRNKAKIVYDYRDRNDLLIVKADRIINQGLDQINNIFDTTTDFNKRDLSSLTITTGILFDKLRILQGRSTSNVSISQAIIKVSEARQAASVARDRLDLLCNVQA